MPTVIDSLIVELGLDPAQFDREQKRVAGRLAGFRQQSQRDAKGIEDSLKRISDEFEGMVKKALGFVGSLVGVHVVVSVAKDIVETNRTLGNLADVMQESVQRLSALGNVFERLGASSGGAMDAVANFDRQIKEMNLGTMSALDSPMMKFLNSISVAGGRVNPMDAKGRFKPAIDIFVEAAEAISKLNVPQDIKAGLWQQLGLDTDTIAVALRGGAALRKHLEEQQKIYAITPEQRAKTDKLRQQMYDLIQRGKSLGQVVLADLADGLGKVLEVMSRFVDFLNKTLQDPTGVLYLPSMANIKEYFGGGAPGESGGEGGGAAVGGQGAMGGSVHGHRVDPYGGLEGRTLYEPMTGWMGGGVGGHSAKFGAGQHEGVDVMGKVGTPIYAIASGTVVTAPTKNGGLDQVLTIDHGGGFYSRLLHQGPGTVNPGDHVEGGQVVGSSGFRNAAHSHVEMWRGRPGASGSVLMNPKAIFRWDKSNPAVGGREVVVGAPGGQQSRDQQASKDKAGGWPAPLTAVPFLNLRPMSLKPPTVSNTTRTDISSVNVNTGASDASAIASDIARELKRQMRESLPSQQLINARTPAEANAAMQAAERARAAAEAP